MTSQTEQMSVAADQRAIFASLADQHLGEAYRLAAVILGDRIEAEDATHDAVVTAWKRYLTLRDQDRFRPWFQRILINTCRDRMRRKRRRPVLEIEVAHETAAATDAFAGVDDRLALDRAFGSLSPDHRIVIALRYYVDLSVDDIAERLGVPTGTVKSRLHLATRKLHAVLDGRPEDER